MDSLGVPQSHDQNMSNSASAQAEVAAMQQDGPTNDEISMPSSNNKNAAAVKSQEPELRTADQDSEPQAEDTSLADPSPYGTRSRNRNTNARPNYAEDQDMDFDFVAPPAKPVTTRPNNTATDSKDPKRVATDTSATRFISAEGSEQPEKSPSVGKDPVTGTPALPVNQPKKRKAGGGAATGGAAASTANAQASTKRQGPSSGYIPLANMSRESNLMTFEKSKALLKKDGLHADDGAVLKVDDHVYLVCEPPGDPYYLCRIMEFLHTDSDDPKSPVDSIRVNWFYRPRDVQRHNSDTRLVYGTMHSDICPLTSLRGKCQILHRSEIANLDEYRKEKDAFWYSQIFDRFIRRFYELIPTADIINVPEKVKKALDERWKFIAVEIGRVKELTSAVKLCKRCSQFCASHDSVDCAICKNSYHMNCVRPPLPKKPTRGFAWACGPCSRAQEKKLEARQTPVLGQSASATEEEEPLEEEEDDPAQLASTRAPSPSSDVATDQHPGTQAEIAMAKMWPFRYLGIHCRVEDALQYDDRAIYPRASSRLGPRHQANVNVWHGRPVELIKPAEIKKRYVKSNSHKKDGKLSKETIAAIEADRLEKAKRPKWVQDEPQGYVHRGEDYPNDDPRNTARLIFKMPDEDDPIPGEEDHSPAACEAFIDNYMERAKSLAKVIRVADYGSNLLDMALKLLIDNKYNAEDALQQLSKKHRSRDLKEPVLTLDELKKFEEGVTKYGSEHRSVRLHMKTHHPTSTIVRFYYLWKKTPRGRQIWDNHGGRKGKKRNNMDAAAKMQAEVANDMDDSAFDLVKAEKHKRGFQCKFCSTRHSRQWRRAPGVTAGQTVPVDGKATKDTKNRLLLGLCGRCAGLWRRYAIQYEDLDEATRKAAQNGGRGLKRRIDEELLREVLAAHDTAVSTPDAANMALPSIEGSTEPPKKKTKTSAEEKKKEKPPPPPPKLPTPPPPPIVPDQPRWRELPCAVCKVLDAGGEMPVVCSHCKLAVHRRCYGLADQPILPKWVCDQCSNDRNPTVSTDYACTLCPVEETHQELLEPPRVSHKKKTDREREKERLEKELTEEARAEYRNRQKELSRPLIPREPLKRTDGNNWVHVLCATWTPEIRFSHASVLERAEGFSAIPMERYEATCKVCKGNRHGSCVSCLHCKANFHVGCAVQAGYTFGFDVTPVKGSRKDQFVTVTLGEETGYLTAAIWCKDHAVKSIIHSVSETADDTGRSALQLFVENYKQADRTLTGTARKANLLSLSAKLPTQPAASVAAVNRRVSVAGVAAARGARNSSVGLPRNSDDNERASLPAEGPDEAIQRECVNCGIDVSPKWWPVEPSQSPPKTQPEMDQSRDVPMLDATDDVAQTNGNSVVKSEKPNGEGLSRTEIATLPSRSSAGMSPHQPPASVHINRSATDPLGELHDELGNNSSAQHHCHKCHWRMLHEPTPAPEAKRSSPTPPKQAGPGSLATQNNATVSPHQLPASIPAERSRNGMTPGQVPVPHPYLGPYQPTGGFPPPPQALTPNGVNGPYSHVAHPPPQPPQYAQANGHHSPHLGPPSYAPPNGQAPGPNIHHRGSLALSSLPPGPLSLANGLRSPPFPLASPTHMGAGPPPQQQQMFPPPRATESPFGASQQGPPVNGHHGSPPTGFVRPLTPRDSSTETRVVGNAGASASPNLRNLLH